MSNQPANTTIIRPIQKLNLGRRGMFRIAGMTTLSAAAIAVLGGCKTMAATPMVSEGDVNTLNVALGLEHEAINAYQLGAESGPPAKAGARRRGPVPKPPQAASRCPDRRDQEHGGTPVAEKPMNDYAKALNASTLKSQADVLTLAAKLEKGAANAYLGVIPSFESKDLAQVAGRLAADEVMHWTVLASALKQSLPEKALTFGA